MSAPNSPPDYPGPNSPWSNTWTPNLPNNPPQKDLQLQIALTALPPLAGFVIQPDGGTADELANLCFSIANAFIKKSQEPRTMNTIPPTFTFFDTDLPHCPQSNCGFSIHRGILVQWDEDHDTRILHLLDSLPASILDQLIATQEHKGSISFLWKSSTPEDYQENKSVNASDGDSWTIYSSTHIHQDPRTHPHTTP